MLNGTGMLTPCQILISILSSPNVRKMPAKIDINALTINPTYRIDRTGIANKQKNAWIIFISFYS